MTGRSCFAWGMSMSMVNTRKWNIRIALLVLFLVVGMGSMPVQAATKHTCAYAGCTRKVNKDETYCSKHAKKVSKEISKKRSTQCEASGCKKEKVRHSSYCKTHTCKRSNCYNLAVSDGYCYKHAKVSSKSSSSSSKSSSKKRSSNYDSYYEDDPEAFYEDNKDLYDSFDDAMDDWEDEYGDDW